MISLPIWITNFKTYEQATGSRAVDLAKIHEKVALNLGVSVGVAVSAFDLFRVAESVSIPVFAQHCDPVDYGSHTGHLLPQGIKKSSGIGTLLNHSERRLDFETLRDAHVCCQKASLTRVVCAENPEEIEEFAHLGPDFLAFEPPELIGSSTASVASAKPDSISQSVAVARDIPVLVGAGIKSAEDVRISLQLGAKGFLVASAITKADDPEAKLRELLSAFPR
ncbi:MAG: triose-phosphate isomerase [Candidatus Gracilibacteria bacterium]|nr:triose-phosphate isomerase [Candidatus Gracilibacteria bacterium]